MVEFGEFLSGALYASWAEGFSAQEWRGDGARLTVGSSLHGDWLLGKYVSPKPLRDPESERPPFAYEILYRPGRDSHFLLLAPDTAVHDDIAAWLRGSARSRPPRIDVDGLVRSLTKSATAYAVSGLHARVDAWGRAVRTVSFFGDDLLNTDLLRKVLDDVTPYRVVLRDVRVGTDVVQIGSRGEVGFSHRRPTKRTLADVDNALRTVESGGFINWAEVERR